MRSADSYQGPALHDTLTHVDPVPGKRHYRMNIRLAGPDAYRGATLVDLGRVKVFRPDRMPHSVERVARRRVVFSIGWAI